MFMQIDGIIGNAAATERGPAWTALPDDEALLLWSVRRLVIAWPRCHTVHAALNQRYGDAAADVETLLRALLMTVTRHARRPLAIGDPACAVILADERSLLAAVRAPATAASCLAHVVEARALPCVVQLLDALSTARQAAFFNRAA